MSTPSLEEPVSRSDVVFNGTVEETGATTMAAVEASDSTAAVRVDELVRAPSAFEGLVGQRITVLLRAPGSVQAGERATFFVNAAVFGESVAVEEVDHTSATAAAELAPQVSDVIDRLRESDLRARIASADVVVTGRVAHVRPAPEATAAAVPGMPGPVIVTEHAPIWTEAVLDVESVLKGPVPQPPVVVLFPASIDVMWVNAPKFHAGQEATLILHTDQVPEAQVPASVAATFPSVYTALEPGDVLPKEQADDLRGLIDDLGG
jgi:hypothetical protein